MTPDGMDAAGAVSAVEPVRRLLAIAPNPSIDQIVAVGRLVPGEIHRPEVLSVVPGGKGLNVARAAAVLGLPVVVVPILGGHAGAWILDGLVHAGVQVHPVWSDGETRRCVSILDRTTGALTELYEPGVRIGTATWEALEDTTRSALTEDPEGTVAVVSGSAPAGAPADGHRRLVALASGLGVRCVLDVGGSALRHALAARPWVVKVNAAEAAEATGISTTDEVGVVRAARAICAGGAGMALVSRGVDGAVLLDEAGRAWRIGPPGEHGRFPVGSGDSMLAGFVAALADGAGTAEAVRRASAAAAANALRPGQGDLDPADAERLLAGITLVAIDP
jgi:1-phosphofructokinase family hexose kinase